MTNSESNCWIKLQAQTTQVGELLQGMLAHDQSIDSVKLSESMQDYIEHWASIAALAVENEQDGIQDICMLYQEALQELATQNESLSQEHWQMLENWQVRFLDYLQSPDSQAIAKILVECLKNPLWPSPLLDDDAEMLVIMLLSMTEQAPVKGSFTEDIATEEEQPDFYPEDQVSTSNESTQEVGPELVLMIHDEFKILADEFTMEPAFTGGAFDEPAFKEAMDHHLYKLENIGKAAGTINLPGVQQLCEHMQLKMRTRRASDPGMMEEEVDLLKSSFPIFLDYLVAVDDSAKIQNLIEHFQSSNWIEPMSAEKAAELIDVLHTTQLVSKEHTLESRQTVVHAEEVSLSLPEDVNKELLDSLINELPTLTENFSAAIQRIIGGGNVQDLEEAQRIAHTLKGSCNIVGIVGIATLTHHLEEILEVLASQAVMPPQVLANVLMDASDCLEAMCEAVTGVGEVPEQALSVLQDVLNWANLIAVEGIPQSDADIIIPETSVVETEEQKTEQVTVAMTRISSSLIDEMMRLTGETSILGTQLAEQLAQINAETKYNRDLNWKLHQLIDELDHQVNIQGLSSQRTQQNRNQDFDALEMDQYNELHTCSSSLAEIVADVRELGLDIEKRISRLSSLLIDQEKLLKTNQELVLQTRMIAVQSIVSRCQRIVRQACRMSGKEVELEILGTDIQIDSEILNQLVDPIMHLLRNAVDHGIEISEQRMQAGKEAKGLIKLEFMLTGNQILVTCEDDGSGLDYAKIFSTGIDKGLIEPGQEFTDEELNAVIFTPGFSTRDTATQLSGRGIGMDAIRTNILKIKGSMNIKSETGLGLKVTLSFPVTLNSVQALLIRCGSLVIAIANHGVKQVIHAGAGELREADGEFLYYLDDQTYKPHLLQTLLNIPVLPTQDPRHPCLLIENDSGKTEAVMIDEIFDNRNLVVKSMGQYITYVPGVIGGAILGDGEVTLVLDLPELLRINKQGSVLSSEYLLDGDADQVSGLPSALVVDDSLSARRSLAQLLKDCGVDVNTAIDGLDAIESIEKKQPDILLVDMEMPRMNGIELTAHVRSRAELKNIPVIMITSRSTKKHQRLAEAAGVTLYVTKPYSEDDLMRNVMAALDAVN